MVRRQTRVKKRNRRQQNKTRNNRRQNKSLRRKRKSRRKLRGGSGPYRNSPIYFRDNHLKSVGSDLLPWQRDLREKERLEKLGAEANKAGMSVDNYEQQQREYEAWAGLSRQ